MWATSWTNLSINIPVALIMSALAMVIASEVTKKYFENELEEKIDYFENSEHETERDIE